MKKFNYNIFFKIVFKFKKNDSLDFSIILILQLTKLL